MKKKIAKCFRRLADWFYPQAIPPMILPSLNDVKRLESSFDIRQLQAQHAISEDKVRDYMRFNIPYNEIMNKALVEKLVEAMLDSDAVKFEEHIHPGMDRTFTASIYIGIKRK